MLRRLKSLLVTLRVLKQKGAIASGTYYDYICLILCAETPDQLEQIAQDLAQMAYFNGDPEHSKVLQSEDRKIDSTPLRRRREARSLSSQ